MGTFRMLDVAKVPGGMGFVDDLRSGGGHFDRCRDGFSQTGVRAAQLTCRRNGGRAGMHCSPSSGHSASLALRKRHGQLTQWQADVGSRLLVLCCVRGSSAPGALASEMSTTVAGGAGESGVEERTSTANAVPDTPLVAQSKLLRKLSDANLCIRQLRRELQARDETIADFKAQIVALELELKALARISLEVATAGALPGIRKINGRYLQSHLAFRLEEIHNGLLSQIREVEVVRDIELVWMGMAESVQVMGSFDGWTDGVEMSPLVTGAYTRFVGTLKLPRGRYEIKFLVDGEWQLSPELLVVGEGLACNNLLVVE